MGYALIWVEGLAVALTSVALALAWAARGGAIRYLWAALVTLLFLAAGSAAVLAAFASYQEYGPFVRTTWLPYTLTWLLAFAGLGMGIVRFGRGRVEPGSIRAAATWPRHRLWLGFAGAVLAFGLTFWNMDLASRADLAIARQEAGAVVMTMTPPAVADEANAVRVYAEASKELGEPIPSMWIEATRRGLDARQRVDWKHAYAVELVKRHEATLATLRRGAALPQCQFDRPRGLLDVVAPDDPMAKALRTTGLTLLATDARIQAGRGNLKRAFEDVAAILGIVRQLGETQSMTWAMESVAWRTLEEILRLAPGRDPVPPLEADGLPALVRKVREENALHGMVGPVVASEPSRVVEDARTNVGPLGAWTVEWVLAPAARVFLVPDELAAMRKQLEDYRTAPRGSRDETPEHWAELQRSVRTDPMSAFGAAFIKPKHRKIADDASALAALRATSRTGLAVEGYRRKTGQYPDRLERLVPEFLPSVPVDPRDGQPLRLARTADWIVVYAPQDRAFVEKGNVVDPETYRVPPLFRLPVR